MKRSPSKEKSSEPLKGAAVGRAEVSTVGLSCNMSMPETLRTRPEPDPNASLTRGENPVQPRRRDALGPAHRNPAHRNRAHPNRA
ncbi:hypothetical protein GCM10017602_14670 [Herbiconiux flava]|nr:hypothetical protein GCM10017602_14670 [Herbiconiux flava]